jgi:signal transduction histidine kinase
MKLDFAFVVDQAGWPAFLVDESGTIRRANSAAVSALGKVMEGESSLAASIWSPQNTMTAEEFLGHLKRSSLSETQLQFRVKGGGSSWFTAYVCPFQREGKKFRLFQLLPPTSPPASDVQAETQPTAEASSATETAMQPATIEVGAAQKQKLDCALQLIRTVALDFNNALTTILGHSSLMLSRAEPGHPWRNSLIQVELSAEKAAEIAQDLADFSRQEKDVRSRAPGNLNKVLRSAVEVFQGPEQSNILWTMQLEKRLYTVSFEEAKMQQAFVKVLENAVEAVGTQGRIVVRTLNHSFSEPVTNPSLRLAAGHYVCIEISDNGCGIEVEAQPRVFEPFFTTKSHSKHRGLGLAWVYGIVTNHGGVVSVTSDRGAGTLVRIFLPAQQKIVRDQGTKVDDLRGHETVLFVDDEEMLLNLGQTVLSAFGYTVLTANSGQRALELFKDNSSRIQLVVTDLVMPGMSGRELVDRLRRLASKVPILRTSGYVRQGGDADDETYLRKPFTSQELLRRVRHLLSQAGTQQT